MAAPSRVNDDHPQRQPVPATAEGAGQLSGDLVVMAALIGISRAFFGRRNTDPVKRFLDGLQEPSSDTAGRGRQSDTPSRIPVKGWKDIAWRINQSIQDDRLLLVAAGVTFYGLLALFPATAALVSLYGVFADAATINEHIRLLSGFLPDGALEVIGDQVRRITSQGQGALGLAFLGTLVLSLWGANAGTKAIFDALNIIYKEGEERGFIKLTIWSLALTVGAIVLALLALAGIVAVPVAIKLLGISEQSGVWLLSLLRWPLLYLLILFALACLYRYGPSRTHPQWRWVTWGSSIAGAIWIAGSLLFSWYVTNFGNYNATYGSLGAVIGFMVWMWLSIIVVLLGGEINAEIEHQTSKDTPEGLDKPRGARGARMADGIGGARA